jgi:hypothetical protein
MQAADAYMEHSAIKETCDGRSCLIALIFCVLPGTVGNFTESSPEGTALQSITFFSPVI